MRNLGLEKLASPRFFFGGGRGGPFWIENTSNDFLAVFYGRVFFLGNHSGIRILGMTFWHVLLLPVVNPESLEW